jgi:hypothetical protein
MKYLQYISLAEGFTLEYTKNFKNKSNIWTKTISRHMA